MTRFLLAAIVVIIGFSAAPAFADSSTPAAFADLERDMPKRERDFLAIIGDARGQFKTTRSDAARTDIRVSMQIRITNFVVESAKADGWLGIVKRMGTTREGDSWIEIEIAPDLTLLTSQNLDLDPDHVTLIRKGSGVDKSIADIGVDQVVIFSGTMVRYLTGTDEDMVQHPKIYSHFTDIHVP